MPDLFAAVVPDSLLTVLRVIFLILLYLFFVRVIRAVWSELREPKNVEVFAGGPDLRAPGPGPVPGRGRSRTGAERLVVVEPADRKGQVFELGDELTVGRAAGCGVSLPDDTFVSQVHARVFRRDGSLFVEDLGSTNGTFLNRKAVSGPMALRKGDRVQVGRSVLEVSR
ncbi:MAG TPA: FHA domain-containing protein [Acidimicrobiales bacterium]